MKDYYNILGVHKEASQDEIKKAYRLKAKTLHPDMDRSVDAKIRFQLLSEAYQTLNDVEKRSAYDMMVKYGVNKEKIIHRYRKYGTSKGFGQYSHYYQTGYKKNKTKDKKTIYFDNTMYYLFLGIGILALVFSIMDLLERSWESKMNGLRGLLFSISYLILLMYGWSLYKKAQR